MGKIEDIYEKWSTPGCMCGTFEYCEYCDTGSAFNRLRKDIKEAIYGKEPPLTAKDYGRSITISREDLK